MKLNLMSLGDYITDPITGELPTPAQRHRMLVEAAVVAESAGFNGVNIGEHHGIDYIYSAPPVVLAAIAERTTTLRLGTAVTLLANLDALRAAEDYATLDVLSNGRVDVVAGRGNFFASTYTLFGQSLDESRERFDEGVELFDKLWTSGPLKWTGEFRPPINGEALQPQPLQPRTPMWIGGGSSPETAELAARLGFKLMLPSAFGNPSVFQPVAETYREQYLQAGHDTEPEVGGCWHVNVAGTVRTRRPAGSLAIAATTSGCASCSCKSTRPCPSTCSSRSTTSGCSRTARRSWGARPRWSNGSAISARCSAAPRPTSSTWRWVACPSPSCSRWSS